ncbi:hypothetical protein [Anabaena azotica]|uniref:Uncharacterized protein n=1 Tax=Anabaena azotica FACHB-119 TaxID=947527 RepID=A0ABR8DBH4_9NOST|nr:hypothetical protein [Anabaena azotica]MBD2504565.1 hypothetical protein [Anabaena azotica FACHB-119]
MEISEYMVRSYLWYVTGFWIIKNDLPADHLFEYDEYIESMKKNAIYNDDLDTLKLAFEHILANPEIDTASLSESDYPWDDAKVREIIRYSWEKIWPDAPPILPGVPTGVKLVKKH